MLALLIVDEGDVNIKLCECKYYIYTVRAGARKTYKNSVIFDLVCWHVCVVQDSVHPSLSLSETRHGTCRKSELEVKSHDQSKCLSMCVLDLSVCVSVCASLRAAWRKTYK